MPYPLPYILLALFYAAVGYVRYRLTDEDQKLYCDIVSIAVFVVFFGFRGYLLTDWMLYYPYYHDLEWSGLLDMFNPNKSGGMEPGFALLCMVCKTVSGGNYHFLEFTVTCLFSACVFRFLRHYSGNTALGLMLFIAFDGVGIICNLLRNSLAIGIFLIALPYLEQRRPVHYFLMIFLAVTFHLSALVYVPLYFFFHLFPNRWIYLGVFVVANAAFVTRFSNVEQLIEMMGFTGDAALKVDAYTGRLTNSLPIFTIGYIERLLTGTLIILYHDKLKELHQGSGVIVNGVFMYLIMFFFFSQFEVLARRFSFLFCFGYWVVWLDFLRCFFYSNNRRLLAFFIVAYSIIHAWRLYNSPGFYYENVLTGAQSYNERLYFHNRNFHE